MNAYGVSASRSIHVLVCGTETIVFTNIYQTTIALAWDQQTTGSTTKVHSKGYVLSMV